MTEKVIKQIFKDTEYVRIGGSAEELRTAEYIKAHLKASNLEAVLMPFEVQMAEGIQASLQIDGKDIPCKGYLCAACQSVSAPLYYLRASDKLSLSKCKGKIVLFDGYLGYWKYHDILENGAVGFISYDGNINYRDKDIDSRELRAYVAEGKKLPGVNINAKDAVKIVESGAKEATITLDMNEYAGTSNNVILDIPGKSDRTIVLTAHYDSTPLSKGAYDNMSGSIALIALAEHFCKHVPKYSLRFIWCASEERGLLGSKAYCASNKEELEKIDLCINIDMIGCIMGKFIACCTSEDKLVSYLSYMGDELGFQISAYQDVYSSDSTPFSDNGIPSVSFARSTPSGTGTIHNSYDTKALISTSQMLADIDFIRAFTERMANAALCPVAREIPENMKEKLDEYLCRKRKKDDR